MVAIHNSMNAALLLLRNNSEGMPGSKIAADAVEAISASSSGRISKAESSFKTPIRETTAPIATDVAAQKPVALNLVKPIDVQRDSAVTDGTAEEPQDKITLAEADQMLQKLEKSATDYAARAYEIAVRIKESPKADEPQLTGWEAEQASARSRTMKTVAIVMAANARYNKLEHVTNTLWGDKDSPFTASVNQWIDIENSRAERHSVEGVMSMSLVLSNAGVGNVVYQKDSGEFRLRGFQIHSLDGKLVTELTEDGRFREYGEDGSLSKEYSRLDTAELASTTSGANDGAFYGSLAIHNPTLYSDARFY